MLERTIGDRPADVVEAILAFNPTILGLGVYVWNASQTLDIVRMMKQLRPDIRIVLGGPEVSHELEDQPLVTLADYVVTGEGEVAFRQLVEAIEAGRPPAHKVHPGGKPSLTELRMPYALYSDEDLRHRIIYVEASRGCPYTCEFCLSALDEGVRPFPLEPFLKELDALLERGLRTFKFVDRTFNLKLDVSLAIVQFFFERLPRMNDLFLHFEMIPDRLPEPLRAVLAKFPPGAIQLELGVQTLNPVVGATIRRRQNTERLADNFRFLRQHTGTHLHADLIVGLPGETLESFGQGFDALFALGPHEIQVGILKRLRGAPIRRHTHSHGMVYAATPPYEVLQTNALSFHDVQRLKRFARYYDLVLNNGRFPMLAHLLMQGDSAFEAFLRFSDWLWTTTRATHGIAAARLARLIEQYLVCAGVDSSAVARALEKDLTVNSERAHPSSHAARQQRHHALFSAH
jgi:hypothetical protein